MRAEANLTGARRPQNGDSVFRDVRRDEISSPFSSYESEVKQPSHAKWSLRRCHAVSLPS